MTTLPLDSRSAFSGTYGLAGAFAPLPVRASATP